MLFSCVMDHDKDKYTGVLNSILMCFLFNYSYIDVVARWPGSTHDAAVFDQSNVKVILI